MCCDVLAAHCSCKARGIAPDERVPYDDDFAFAFRLTRPTRPTRRARGRNEWWLGRVFALLRKSAGESFDRAV